MIPCPVCLVVLDGGGGRCEAHIDWTFGRVWLAGVWPCLDELAAEPRDPGKTAQLYAATRGHFFNVTTAALNKFTSEQRPRYERGVFLGFRHWRDGYPCHRDGYAQFAAGIVVPALAWRELVARDQVEGIGHLFYDGAADSPTRGAGVELLIIEGPPR